MTETYTEQLTRIQDEIAKYSLEDREAIALYASDLREIITKDSRCVVATILVTAELVAAMAETEDAGNTDWISVKDQLPIIVQRHSKDVAILGHIKDLVIKTIGYYGLGFVERLGNRWVSYEPELDGVIEVTHWYPLPDAPEGME